VILACHFFTADLLDGTQAQVLAVIEHATRRIRILGVTLHPHPELVADRICRCADAVGRERYRIHQLRPRRSRHPQIAWAKLGSLVRARSCCEVVDQPPGDGLIPLRPRLTRKRRVCADAYLVSRIVPATRQKPTS
jgi:hypothetical protein